LREKSVKLEGVSVRYRDTSVLRDVSLQVERGEMLSIIGSSGSGKTTLAKVMCGVVKPDSGQCFTGLTWMVKQLGETSQSTPYKISEIVSLGSRNRSSFITRAERREAERLLDELGLGGLYNRRIYELSGGQQQRTYIAQALMSEAETLILDEPTSGADAGVTLEMMEVLRKVATEGTAIVIATHDIERVAMKTDRAVALRDGGVFYDGLPCDLDEDLIKHVYASQRDAR
jgi:ABC-type Mn2+/Zn2+ transport system ATPase subunit